MKAVFVGAMFLLAVNCPNVASGSVAGSGLRKLSQSTSPPAGRSPVQAVRAVIAAAAEAGRLVGAGRPLDPAAGNNYASIARPAVANGVNPSVTCYIINQGQYCDYAEQQNCCMSYDRNRGMYLSCVAHSNLENCPGDRPFKFYICHDCQQEFDDGISLNSIVPILRSRRGGPPRRR